MARKLILLSLLLISVSLFVSCGGVSESAITKIQRDRMAYVGTVPFEPPLMFQIGADLVGPDAELGQRIINRIQEMRESPTGSEVKLTWINRTYSSLVPALLNGEVDLVIGVFAISDARAKEVQFSDPYYTAELVLIVNPVHRDVLPGDLSGAKIGVREGTGVESFAKEKYPSSTLVPFKTLDDAVLALRRSEVDAVIDDKLMAAYSLATTPGAGHMEFNPEVLGTLDCGVAMRKGDQELLKLVNEIIGELKEEGQFTVWAQEHSGDQVQAVTERRTTRLAAKEKAAEPRSITVRVSKDDSFDFDIYKMANLRFVFRETSSGETHSTSRIDFQGRTGVSSAEVPPGSYSLSLAKFNFSTNVTINPTDPSRISINIRLTNNGVVVRKS